MGKRIHHSQHLPTGCNLPRIEHQGRTFLLYKDLSETRPSKCHRAKKVAEYEMDLIASRRYQPGTEEPAKIDCIMMPVSELPVSAGLGAFLEGEMFQQIQVPASSVPAGAEFGIYVSGDSMEPRYHSGQIVWVKHCEELECGDIGIFVYDDCGYLKNTMNIPQTSPKQSSLPTAMAWCITNRFWFLLTPNIRQSLYLQSKDLRSLEKF